MPELFARLQAQGGRLVRRAGVVSVEAMSVTPEIEASLRHHQADLLLLLAEPEPEPKPKAEPTADEPFDDPEEEAAFQAFRAELDAIDPNDTTDRIGEAIRRWRAEADAKQLTP
jgi:hypothetical protein